jgi:hypothetical protein
MESVAVTAVVTAFFPALLAAAEGPLDFGIDER